MKYTSIHPSILNRALLIAFALILSSGALLNAQTLTLPLSTGYTFEVKNMPPTLCSASATTTTVNYYWWLPGAIWTGYADAFMASKPFNQNRGSNHIFEARKQNIISVDVPNIGDLYGANITGLNYRYGTKKGIAAEGLISELDLESSPGNIRFNIPVTFSEADEDAYLLFTVKDGNFIAGTGVTNIVYVPITVTGPTVGPDVAVPILDTIVDPQMPYLVLHAPPGDGSSSSFVENTKTCQRVESKVADALSNKVDLAVKIGTAGEAGLFVTTKWEFSVTFSAGLTIQDKSISTEAYETCLSLSKGFSTSSLTNGEGGGDVFIGYGSDLGLAAYELVIADQETCSVGRDSAVVFARLPNTEREFAYTSDGIRSDISDLEAKINDSITYNARSRNDFQNQVDVWKQVLELNEANVNDTTNELMESLSFDSRTSQTRTKSIKVLESNSIQYEVFTEARAGIKTKIEVAGSGFSGGYEFKASRTLGETRNQNQEEAQVVSYTLSDNTPGDKFDVKIYRDPMFGTPIFKVLESSKTSCPYQGGYQRDQPYLTFEDGTQTLTLEDIPVGSTRNFKVNICNNSTDARTYYLQGNSTTNVKNSVIEGFGNNLFANTDLGVEFYQVAGGSCIEDAVISIRQSDLEELDYENIELYLYTACQPPNQPIASKVILNAHFVEEITGIGMDDFARKMSVYPNPNTGQFSVNFDGMEESGELYLMDVSGKPLMNRNVEAGTERIELNAMDLQPGFYLVVYENQHGRMTKKIMVEN